MHPHTGADGLRQRRMLWLFLAVGWTILIFVGCSLPGKDLPKVDMFDHVDKVVHVVFFLVFGWLWGKVTRKHLLILLIAVLYGFGLEFYQRSFVAGRSFDVWDGLADSIGALVAYAQYRLSSRSRNGLTNPQNAYASEDEINPIESLID